MPLLFFIYKTAKNYYFLAKSYKKSRPVRVGSHKEVENSVFGERFFQRFFIGKRVDGAAGERGERAAYVAAAKHARKIRFTLVQRAQNAREKGVARARCIYGRTRSVSARTIPPRNAAALPLPPSVKKTVFPPADAFKSASSCVDSG